MHAPDPPSSGPPSDATDDEAPVAAVPAVVAIVVAHDPGGWFEECLTSLADQDYPRLRTVVVDAGSATPVAARVEASLPDATLLRIDEAVGFGPAVAAALDDVADSPFVLVCHDDVRLHADVVRLLVEEAYRSNAGILGPKLVAWDDERVLVHVGSAIDKTGVQLPFAEPGERDQQQHDAVRDVAVVSGGVQLVRTDLLRALGGFDPALDLLGEDLDLCWRAAVAGARVLVVPRAVAAHREGLADRGTLDDRRRRLARARLRTTLVCYGRWHRLRVLPQAAVLTLVEVIAALLLGHLGQARDVAGAWPWNLRRLGDVRRRRRALHTMRRVSDRELRRGQVRGSARVTAFVRGQIGAEQRTGGVAALQQSITGPSLRVAIGTWAVVLLVLAVGSRHLITRGVPAVGTFGMLPDADTLLEHLVAVYRDGWTGIDAASSTGLLLLLAPIAVLPDALLRTALIVGMLPLGAVGAWRLASPLASRRTAAALLVLYLAMPLGYDAMAAGSWSGLLLYGTTPWLVLRAARAARLAPYGDRRWPLRRDVVSLGVLVAVITAFVPGAVVVVAIVLGGLALGGLVAIAPRGILRLLGVSLAAIGLGAALQLPWLLELADAGWAAVVGPRAIVEGQHDLGALIRFDVGPFGDTPLGWLLLVPGTFSLLVGRDWRFTWAVRGWVLALSSWGVAWAATQGWMPFAVPEAAVTLAPAAVGLALAGAMGVAVIEEDLPDHHLGWRQLLGAVSVAAMLVSLLPVLGEALGGRWEVPRGDLDTIVAFSSERSAPADGQARVLWIGDPAVITGDAREVRPGTVAVVTSGARSSILDSWPVGPTAADAHLLAAVQRAVEGGSGRLGQELGVYGIRYVIAPQQSAPAPYGGTIARTDPIVLDALAQQLDLARIDVNAGVVVYRNEAWAPVTGLIDEASVGDPVASAPPGEPLSVPPVLRSPRTYPDRRGVVSAGTTVRAASASARWQLEVDGEVLRPEVVADGVLAFPVSEGGDASLHHRPSQDLRAAAAGQAVLWVVALGLLLRWRSRAERATGPVEIGGAP